MGRQSSLESIPSEVRAQLINRLFDSGFTDYGGHAAWAKELGYNLSKSSIQRIGAAIEDDFLDRDIRIRVVEAASRYSTESTILENSTELCGGF